MRSESSTVDDAVTHDAAIPRNGVLVLTGYGIRVAVERGHLAVSDGRGRERREGRFPRTTRDLNRLVVLGHTGSISFDALRWLHDIGCAFVQIDRDGRVITACGPAGLNDARLRRSQALATVNGTGVALARNLLGRKLDGQADVLDTLDGGPIAADNVRHLRDALETATTTDHLRIIEARAAAIYWGVWTALPVRFARKALDRVPDHWRTVGARHSPLTSSPRTAANPANAILNYLYAIAEAECRIALLAVGLDPGLGIVHADQRNRDSFACDVMEAIRPAIDAFTLDLIRRRPFGTGDFFETRQGACRLMPPVTRMLAETAPRWAAAVAPIVEGIARELLSNGGITRVASTPLTQANRRDGRAKVRTHPKRDTPASDASRLTNKQIAACQDCGVVLEDVTRRYCDACLPDVRREREKRVFAVAGLAILETRRVAGTDPAHGGEAGKARGRTNAAHVAAIIEWEREQRSMPESGAETRPATSQDTSFTRDILPALQGVPLLAMAKATGLTPGYCSFIRRGLKVPHRRHWAALAELGAGRSKPRQNLPGR